jgi:eukaryotic-like serine/threonine-protein kinase
MTPELWGRLKPLFNAALEVPSNERRALIEKWCADEPELVGQLLELVDAHEKLDGKSIVLADVKEVFQKPEPAFSPSEIVLGRFQIVCLIGSGGMGDVYKAIDRELNQAVALKTIRPAIADSPTSFSRFKREVLLARRVSGPNVCRIHELFRVESGTGKPRCDFITMEFLDGITLADRLKQTGPLRWREALPIARDICSGLTSIHDAGIVHRDLKTRNIMLVGNRGAARAVLMDFGLARETAPVASVGETGITTTRVVLGTPDYMAPEQFGSRDVQAATDIFALGIVLHEMVTGRNPFAAENLLHAAMLRRQPPSLSLHEHDVPHQWDHVIRKCLQIAPEQRYASAQQVARALEGRPPSRTASPIAANRWILGAVAVAVTLLVGGIWYFSRPLPMPRVTSYKQLTHDGRSKELVGTDGSRLYYNRDLGIIGQVSVSGGESALIPVPLDHVTKLTDTSRDGSDLLIVTRRNGYHPDGQIWVVRTFGGAIHRLPDGWTGAFSPDGNFVAYSTVADRGIWVVGTDGTGVRRLASIEASTITWSPDGSTIRAFTGDGRLWEISADGSSQHELQVHWPPFAYRCCGRWTPDGKFFLFLNGTAHGYYPQPEIWALDERHRLFRHAPTEPIQLTSGPMEWGLPTPSPDGKTIYADALLTRGELSRFDAKAGHFQPYLGGISAQGVSFSPDGRSVAYVSLPEGVLWKADRDGSNPVQLSEPGMDVGLPRWSPDSTQILFYELTGSEASPGHMYIASTTGGALRRVIPEDPFLELDPGWSRDGQKILFASPSQRQHGHDPGDDDWVLRILDLKSNQLTNVPGSTGSYSPRWSPDGTYIAALSRDSLSLRILDTRSQRWSAIKAKEYLAFPEWSADSRWIYFIHISSPPGIFRVRPTGGEPQRVVDLTDFHVIGWFHTWFTLDPDGAPLIVKDVGSHDLYALALQLK